MLAPSLLKPAVELKPTSNRLLEPARKRASLQVREAELIERTAYFFGDERLQ